MAKRKFITKRQNTLAGQILFAEARARLDNILEMIDEFNEIRDGLEEMGYGPLPRDIHGFALNYPLPFLELMGNGNMTVRADDGTLDEFWQAGPTGKQSADVTQRQMSSRAERRRLGLAAEWKCFYCGGTGDEQGGADGRVWHVDHAYPVIRGGDNQPDNRVLACATCNLEKKARSAAEYFQLKRNAFELNRAIAGPELA